MATKKPSGISGSRRFCACTSGRSAISAACRASSATTIWRPRCVRACLYDPDTHVVYAAFAQHWGFTPLPIQPRTPQENGKQERSGGYVKDNALKGRRFDSLDAQNAHLRHWNRTIARLRIHGTTRRQVWTHFLETEQPRPAAARRDAVSDLRERHADRASRRPCRGRRRVLSGAAALLGRDVRAEWDAPWSASSTATRSSPCIARVPPGLYAPHARRGGAEPTTRQRAFVERLLGRCGQVGAPLRAVGRGRDHRARRPRDSPDSRRARPHAPTSARTRAARRDRRADASALPLQRAGAARRRRRPPAPPRPLLADDPAIRPLTGYTLELFR